MGTWAFRIMRMKEPEITGHPEEYIYGVVECFFDKKGKATGWTDFVRPMEKTPEELMDSLLAMIQGAWAGALDQEQMRESLRPSRAKKPKPGAKTEGPEEIKEISANCSSPEEEVPNLAPITILVRQTNEGRYQGQEFGNPTSRTFEVHTLDEVEEKAKQILWDGLEPTARPEIQICYAWGTSILPGPPK